MWDDLQRGLFIGFTVSIPVGPVALLVIRRSMVGSRAIGIISGFGAATVDLICGTIAVIGLHGLTMVIQHHEHVLRLVGGLFLIGFGVQTLRSSSNEDTGEGTSRLSPIKAYLTTAGLTIANPLTWLGLIFVSAAAGVGTGTLSPGRTAVTSLGICTASASWWLLLSLVAAWLGQKMGAKLLRGVNLVAGCALVAVGTFQIFEIIKKHWL